ncbi:hypothetical protein J6590_093953 [Homalodisca vitripennis]|nr:hypothetical protein J6590_093953 [Homalodisca vitripennis]
MLSYWPGRELIGFQSFIKKGVVWNIELFVRLQITVWSGDRFRNKLLRWQPRSSLLDNIHPSLPPQDITSGPPTDHTSESCSSKVTQWNAAIDSHC